MKGFNNCRCRKCGKRIGWFGEIAEPQTCPKCGYVNDFSEVEKLLQEARDKVLKNDSTHGRRTI